MDTSPCAQRGRRERNAARPAACLLPVLLALVTCGQGVSGPAGSRVDPPILPADSAARTNDDSTVAVLEYPSALKADRMP